MKKTRLLWLIPVITALFVSCQKEVNLQNDNNQGGTGGTGGTGNNNKDIVGDYSFVGVDGDTKTTITVGTPLGSSKTITTASYKSTNNSGTIKITANKLIYTDVAYSINTTEHVQLFLGSVSLGDQDLPFQEDSPASSGEETYVKNNNDSLTFSNAIFVADNPFQTNVPPAPMGARISWKGDTLLLSIKQTFAGSISQQGTPADFTGSVVGVMKMKKK
jgi:hypothetical protein